MKHIAIQLSVLYFLCYIYQNDSKKTFRLCLGKHKIRRDPLGDNSLKQKSLWRYRDSNTAMVNYLQDWGYIKWQKIKDVFLKVDRKDFVYEKPYEDIPKHLGYCSWISSPHTVATILDLVYLNLHKGAKVLEIGSGSGYLLTLMAHLVGPTGHVTGLEHMMDICIDSIANVSLHHIGLIANETIDIIHRDGRDGYPEGGPYDCIIASCAFPEWPTHLEDQIANGGRLVVPVGQEGQIQNLTVMDKLLLGTKYWYTHAPCSFEPLADAEEQEEKSHKNETYVTVSRGITSTTEKIESNWVRSEIANDFSYYRRYKNTSAFKGEW